MKQRKTFKVSHLNPLSIQNNVGEKISIILTILIFITSIAVAKSISIDLGTNKSEVKVIENTYQKLCISLSFSEIKSFEVQTEKGIFTEIIIPGFGRSYKIGEPKLPILRKLVEIPLEAQVEVKAISYEITEYNLEDYGITYPLIPAQPPIPKDKKIEFKYNPSVYQIDEYVSEKLASVDELGIMRSVRLGRLNISPIQYNPVKNSIKVFNNIEVDIQFIGEDIHKTIQLKEKTFSPYFEGIYNRIINYKPIESRDIITRYPVKYVIVADPMFEGALEPFIEWKSQKGFYIITGYTDDPAVGNTTGSIRTYLEGLYNQGTPDDPAPSFVLFVGDVAQIPAFTSGWHVTDLYYCEYTADYLPEMYYGRFSANNLTELLPQIDKTLEYEKYEMPDPSFLNEVVMISGVDAGHAPTWGNGQINYGTTYYFNEAHGITSHTYLYPQSGSSGPQIIQNVSDGVAYANYTAHGSPNGWADPSFTIGNISGLQNQSKYPLMVGNACSTNEFQEYNCFGEALLRAENKGALGYIGGSNSTYWDEDYWWGVGYGAISANPTYEQTGLGAYDRTFHDHGEPEVEWYVTQDGMIFAGNLAVTEAGSGMYDYYWEIYHLMGDPSLSVYYSEPSEMTVTFNALLPIGAEEFTIEAEPGSYVGISMDGILHGAALVDESGTVDVPITPFTQAGIADIIVTKSQYQPVLTTVVVASPAVVDISPTSIPVNVATDVMISVFEEDGTTPIPDVNIEVTGPGVFGDTEGITDASGLCTLNFGGEYGGNEVLHIRGWRTGDNYDLFNEPMAVTGGIDLTNPDIWVTTTFGLSDTFGLNMPGTVHFIQEETDCIYGIYIVDADTFITALEDSITYTPTTLTDIYACIMKTNYNLYDEIYYTIEVYGTVSGIVTESENGNPVSNAEVRFYEQGGNPTEEPLFSDITDSYGFYEITDEYPVDSYDIYIDKWGFEPYIELGYFLAYGFNTHDIVINLGESGVISGRLYDDFFNISDGNLTYFRSDNGEEFASVQTETDGTYSVVLPDFTYKIYVSASGHVPYAGTLTVSGDAEIDYHLGFAALFDDFEDDNGDFISIPPTGGWEWGEPTAGDIQAYTGINVWATNLNGYYVDNVDWYLDSPEFNVTSPGFFAFYHYYDFEIGSTSGTMYDGGNVKISTNGGTTFSLITPEGGYDGNIAALNQQGFGGSTDSWQQVEFDISSYIGESVILRWHFASDMGVCNYYGWYIDNVLVGDPASSYPVPVVSTEEIHEPTKFALNQNYPNPFSTSTVISFHLATKSHENTPLDSTHLTGQAQIKIYNIKGQIVKTFRIPNPESRTPNIIWDGKDENGKRLSSGIYFYKLITEDRFIVKKMLLLR